MAKTTIRKEFEYLNRLRESGETNMFGATPYLQIRFPKLSKAECRQALLDWMAWVDEDPTRVDL